MQIQASISTYIESLLESIGVGSGIIHFLGITVKLFLVALIAWVVYIVAKKWLARLIIKIAGKTGTTWDDLLFDQRFFNRLALFFTPIVIRIGIASIEWKYMYIFDHLLDSWITIMAAMMIGAILEGVNRIYETYDISKNSPIKVFIQVIMIFIYCAAGLIIINIFTKVSIGALLGGMTAFAAVLMLIFKDSILGLVAGIQLSANKMVRIGDWIVMPSGGADGEVLEINLTTVKVQNWDKTITTIPTYKLVSESFTNWRGMEESDGRRIKRSVNIDVNSIHYLSDADLEALKESVFLNDYIVKKKKEIDDFNASHPNRLDERRLTNIGTFREYMESWLEQNPDINLNMTHMVRQLQPGPTGLPLEIYCFSAQQSWVVYENVQSDIFDHVYAIMELFGLKAYQYSGVTPVEQPKK